MNYSKINQNHFDNMNIIPLGGIRKRFECLCRLCWIEIQKWRKTKKRTRRKRKEYETNKSMPPVHHWVDARDDGREIETTFSKM